MNEELVSALNHRKESQSIVVIQNLIDSGNIINEKEFLMWKD